MLTAAMVLTVLAAVLHVLVFYMESITWKGPLTHKTLGDTPEKARSRAFYISNQGFYNLSLALQALTGATPTVLEHVELGAVLVLVETGAMLAAIVVLVLASAPHRDTVAKQGILPLLAISRTIATLLS